MHTMTLRVEDNMIDKVKIFLQSLPRHDVEIIRDIREKSETTFSIETMGGSLHKYANKEKLEKEESAWALHIEDTYK